MHLLGGLDLEAIGESHVPTMTHPRSQWLVVLEASLHGRTQQPRSQTCCGFVPISGSFLGREGAGQSRW